MMSKTISLTLIFAIILLNLSIYDAHRSYQAQRQEPTNEQNPQINEGISDDEHYIDGKHNPNYNHTEEETKGHRKDFDEYDFDKDGILDAQELRHNEIDVTEDEIMGFFEIADKNEDGMVTFDEYLQAALEVAEREKSEENLEEVQGNSQDQPKEATNTEVDSSGNSGKEEEKLEI